MEVIAINIEIKPKSKLKEFFQGFRSTLEDLLFTIVTNLPESFLSSFLMNWLDSYTTKRTQELQQELVRQHWQQVYLKKAVEEIHSRQAKNPSD